MDEVRPLIRFHDVSLGRDKGPFFEHASFDLMPGDRMAITGKSGCGKSSLLSAILGRARRPKGRMRFAKKGYLRLSKGTIEVGGYRVECRADVIMWLVRNAGVLFQSERSLFEGRTAFYNIAYPLRYGSVRSAHAGQPSMDSPFVAALLKQVELVDDKADGEKVLDVLKSDIGDLSGGQRKRVALARAMALQPRLLLLDEPTSGLDPLTSLTVADTIRKLSVRDGTTVLCITHDPSFAERLDCRTLAEIEKNKRSIALTQRDSAKRASSFVGPDAATGVGLEPQRLRRMLLYGSRIAVRFCRLAWDGFKLCAPVALIAGAGLVVQAVAGPRLIQRFLPEGVTAGVFLGMGTILPALLVIGLSASGLTGELSQMKNDDQLNFLRLIGVRPAFLLGAPFVLAMSLTLPLLVWLSEVLMLAGGYLTLLGFRHQSSISATKFLNEVMRLVEVEMFTRSAVKGVTHGALIGLAVCWFGFRSERGQGGLRKAIAGCVIASSLLVIVADILWSWYWA